VQVTRERELKFQVADGFELPKLRGEPLQPRTFTSTYHDTPDGRLASVEMTLRRRVANGKGVWQLKLPAGAARFEIEAPGGPASPPAEIAALLGALTRGRELGPVAKLRTHRTGVRVVRDGSSAEVVVDNVAVLDARRVVGRFTEVEIEVTGGSDGVVAPVVKALRRAGAEEDGPVPKLRRVVGPVQVDERSPFSGPAEVLRAAIRAQVRALVAHDPGTRLGSEAEELHDMRVAVRRLRAIFRVARPALDEAWSRDLHKRLKWLGGELGPARDLDVMVDQLRGELDELTGPEAGAAARLVHDLEARRLEARAALVSALRSDPYYDLLDDLEEAARSPRIVGEVAPKQWAAKAYERLRETAASLDASAADEKLHEARKEGKRARYAAELAEPLAGKKAARFVKEAKRFQDLVGVHQDAVVSEAQLRDLVRSRSGTVLMAAGRLIERRRAARKMSRQCYERAWKRIEKAGRAAWA
jgi:CHAD domain-containing protein